MQHRPLAGPDMAKGGWSIELLAAALKREVAWTRFFTAPHRFFALSEDDGGATSTASEAAA